MRNLTIKRNKTFVACAVTLNVYIEDPTAQGVTINGVPCRNIGTLKNGEQKTFVVPEAPAKVYLAAEKAGTLFNSEFLQLVEGNADVFASGQNRMNPANGNQFAFDGATDPTTLALRKKSKIKSIIICVVAALVGLLSGFAYFFTSGSPKEFKVDELSITLTGEFNSYDDKDDKTLQCYATEDIIIFISRYKFSEEEGLADCSIEDFLFEDLEVKTVDDLTYQEYDSQVDNKSFHYVCFIFKSDEAFWEIQFATDKDEADDYFNKIITFAKSIKFS